MMAGLNVWGLDCEKGFEMVSRFLIEPCAWGFVVSRIPGLRWRTVDFWLLFIGFEMEGT